MFKKFIKALARSILKTMLDEAAPFIRNGIQDVLKTLYKRAITGTPQNDADDKVIIFLAELVGLKKADLEK